MRPGSQSFLQSPAELDHPAGAHAWRQGSEGAVHFPGTLRAGAVGPWYPQWPWGEEVRGHLAGAGCPLREGGQGVTVPEAQSSWASSLVPGHFGLLWTLGYLWGPHSFPGVTPEWGGVLDPGGAHCVSQPVTILPGR